MTNVREDIRKKIYGHVMADLDPPAIVVHGKIFLALAVGGSLSLLLCGQFGLAFTPFASALQSHLGDVMGLLGCAATCGLIFAVVPALVLRLLTSPMQFYVLTRKKWRELAGWIAAAGVVLALVDGGLAHAADLVPWTLATVAMFLALAWGLRQIATLKGRWQAIGRY